MREGSTIPLIKRRGTRGGRMFLLIFGSWIVVYFAARAVLDHMGPSLPTVVRLAIAIAPVAVLSGVFSLAMRVLSRADELERLIHLLAATITLPLVAVTALAIAMLRRAGIFHGSSDLWPFITGFYLLGYIIARAHYHMDEPDDATDGPPVVMPPRASEPSEP